MLKSHQNETCDAIIRHLEKREGEARHDERVPEVDNRTSPDVEMTFRLGNQLFAIEHTTIEPFEGFIDDHKKADRRFKPLETSITAALGSLLAPGVSVVMGLQVGAFKDRKRSELRSLHEAITAWVAATAPTLPRGADGRGTPISARLPGVPFPVTLTRFDRGGRPGRFKINHLVSGSEEPRELRIERACEHTFPKLDIWKRRDGARTVLVLENNDDQLTDIKPVAEVFLPIAEARADCPDETYMVATGISPWCAWPILVNGRSYFDIAKASDDPICFEIEPPNARDEGR